MGHLRRLHEKYGDRVPFLFVYIREAHHTFPAPLPEVDELADMIPDSRRNLVIRARAGIKHFKMQFPCLLDNEREEVQNLYDAYHKRMLVLDREGRIVVDSGNSPNPPFPWKEATDWLDRFDREKMSN